MNDQTILARIAQWEPQGCSVALLPADQNSLREQITLAVLARDTDPDYNLSLLNTLHAKRGEV